MFTTSLDNPFPLVLIKTKMFFQIQQKKAGFSKFKISKKIENEVELVFGW